MKSAWRCPVVSYEDETIKFLMINMKLNEIKQLETKMLVTLREKKRIFCVTWHLSLNHSKFVCFLEKLLKKLKLKKNISCSAVTHPHLGNCASFALPTHVTHRTGCGTSLQRSIHVTGSLLNVT